jgi:hypothetical protein
MDYGAQLKYIFRVITQTPIDYGELHSAIQTYGELMVGLTEVDLNQESYRRDLHFHDGKALAPLWAAKCLEEIYRTRQFIRGIDQAVAEHFAQKDGPVHLLYVGTGPFATLFLPLTTRYRPDELRVTFMEVNKHSVEVLQRVLHQLDLEDYAVEILTENATAFQLPAPERYDIFVTETMQQALVKEQQVPIMLNIIPQLRSDASIIPTNIILTLTTDAPTTPGHTPARVPLFEFKRSYVDAFLKGSSGSDAFALLNNYPLSKLGCQTKDWLCVETEIHTYGNNWIRGLTSSLTLPWNLINAQRIPSEKTLLSLKYSWSGVPGYQLTFS